MKCRIALAFLFAVLLPSFPGIPKTGISFAQEASPATLKIAGAVSTPLVLTLEDLKKMPRKTMSVLNPHENKTAV
jgi:DMSO/TMAO reductase YedYZ molybdopterin-dependent catalytic subunit